MRSRGQADAQLRQQRHSARVTASSQSMNYEGGLLHSSRNGSERFGSQGDVEAGAVACHAHQEDAGPFEDVGHLEPSCVEGPHVQALQKRRDGCLRLSAVAGEEHVHRLVFSKDALKDRIECLHDVCALGGGGGDPLGHRVARGSDESAGVLIERVGDVDEDLA